MKSEDQRERSLTHQAEHEVRKGVGRERAPGLKNIKRCAARRRKQRGNAWGKSLQVTE